MANCSSIQHRDMSLLYFRSVWCDSLELPSFRRLATIHNANIVIQINDTNKPNIIKNWRLVLSVDESECVAIEIV